MAQTQDLTPNPRSRWVLALVALAFFAPFVAAVVLHLTDWQPARQRNIGEILQPPVSIVDVPAHDDDAKLWLWGNDEQRWTLLLRIAGACDAACVDNLHTLRNVRVSLGRHADRLPQFLFDSGKPVDDLATLTFDVTPEVFGSANGQGAEAWLVDPHGFVAIHYPVGFDPTGLRRDLSRLIK